MESYVPDPPVELYSTEALLGGFEVDDDRSWVSTLDARAFQGFVAAGRRTPPLDVASKQAAHDAAVTSALTMVLEGRQPVAIMGGHQLERGALAYQSVAWIARDLTLAGFVVLSGGGPGAMEAAHLGARMAYLDEETFGWRVASIAVPDRTKFPLRTERELISTRGEFDPDGIRALHAWQVPAFRIAELTAREARTSIGIPTWLYGHEPPTPLATHHAKYFANSIREDGLLAVATYGVVYAPGSAGTLQEIYQDAAQNYYRSVDDIFSPMVFLDTDEVWTSRFAVDTALKQLFKPEDYGTMVEFVNVPTDVVPAIVARRDDVERQRAASRPV